MSATVGQKLFFFLQQRTMREETLQSGYRSLGHAGGVSTKSRARDKKGGGKRARIEGRYQSLFAGGQVNEKGELLQLNGQIHGNHTDPGRQPKHTGSKIQ